MIEPAGEVASVMDPVSESLAGTYAEALLGQVPSDVEAEEAAAELDALVELLDQIEGFEEILTAATLTKAERAAMIERVFHGRVGEPVEAVLNVMAHAGRLGLLRLLRRTFRSALYARQGKREVRVVTAVALAKAERDRTIEMLAGLLGGQPVATFDVDPDLLGGMIVRMADRVYDASVRAELKNLRGRLAREIRLDLPHPQEDHPEPAPDS